MGFFSGKNVLVTGGTGLIGRPLVGMLIDQDARVRVASLDDPSKANPDSEFYRVDLTESSSCRAVCEGMDYAFHLVGTKGSPKAMKERPADFFVPTLLYNTNMMEAARQAGVERYLYTSTVGVYSPAEVFFEDDVWGASPSENDRFAGWAKRMGELQAEAYEIQHGWDKISIVRPSNVYGPHDTLNPDYMTALITITKRALDGENPLVAWGDGSPIRDFVYSEDAARAMMFVLEKGYTSPVNIGSGRETSIRELVGIIVSHMETKPEVVWDATKPKGDQKRIVDTKRIRSLGWEPRTSLEEGVKKTMDWYLTTK